MWLYVWPVVFTLLVWWFSTGAVLFMIGLPRVTHRYTVALWTLVAVGGLYGLAATRDDATVAGAFCAFSSTILVWAWHEMTFLTGLVTGPRTEPLPRDAKGGARLLAAIETVIYHELALFLTALAVAFLVADGANQTGFWTYMILWIMRLSAKLNLFFGVRNWAEGFLPAHLTYLASYFRRRSFNLFFPISVTLSTCALGYLVGQMAEGGLSPHDITSHTCIATILALAVLEHWFMVTEIPADGLWSWGLASRDLTIGKPEGATRCAPSGTEKKPQREISAVA